MDWEQLIVDIVDGNADVGYYDGTERDFTVPDRVDYNGEEEVEIEELEPHEAFSLGAALQQYNNGW